MFTYNTLLPVKRDVNSSENVLPYMSVFGFHKNMPLKLRFECMEWPVLSFLELGAYYDITNKDYLGRYKDDFLRVANHDWEGYFSKWNEVNGRAENPVEEKKVETPKRKLVVKVKRNPEESEKPEHLSEANGQFTRNVCANWNRNPWSAGAWDSKKKMWVPFMDMVDIPCEPNANQVLFDNYTPEQIAKEFDKMFECYERMSRVKDDKGKIPYIRFLKLREALINALEGKMDSRMEGCTPPDFNFIFDGTRTGTLNDKAAEAAYLSDVIRKLRGKKMHRN